MVKSKIVPLSLTFLLAGCMATGPKKHPELGINVPLPVASTYKAGKAEDGRKRIVIIASDNGESVSENKKLADAVFSSLSSRGLNPLDREISSKLRDEILLSANSGKYVMKAQKTADYAVIVTVSAIEYGSEFQKSRQTKSVITDDLVSIPPSCDYTVSARGRIEIRDIAERSLINQIDFDEVNKDSRDNPTDRSCPVTNSYKKMSLRKLYDEAFKTSKSIQTLMSFLSPNYYIVDAFQIDKKVYYKTTVGLGKGVKDGREVDLYSQRPDGTLLFFGKGKFVNEKFADQKHSYISVKEKHQADIKKGTVIKIGSESCSTFDFKCQTQGTILDH